MQGGINRRDFLKLAALSSLGLFPSVRALAKSTDDGENGKEDSEFHGPYEFEQIYQSTGKGSGEYSRIHSADKIGNFNEGDLGFTGELEGYDEVKYAKSNCGSVWYENGYRPSKEALDKIYGENIARCSQSWEPGVPNLDNMEPPKPWTGSLDSNTYTP